MTRRKRPKRQRGRPPLGPQLAQWLEEMQGHIEAGSSVRAAADLIVTRDERLIPQGSRHGQRSFDSTVDLLRREYPKWLEEQERIAEHHASHEALLKSFADIGRAFDSSGFGKMQETVASLARLFPPTDFDRHRPIVEAMRKINAAWISPHKLNPKRR